LAAVLLAVSACSATPTPQASASVDAGELPTYSQADIEEWNQESLRSAARDLAIEDPPQVSIVRIVSQQEWPEAQRTCLTAQGFDAVASGGGLDLSRIPEAQKGPDSPLNRAVYECQAQYPVDPRYTVAPNRAQLEVMYAYFVDETIPCLAEQGVTSLQEPPSAGAFLDASENAGRVAWSPYADEYFLAVSPGEWEQLDSACPSQVPLDLLWR